MNGKQEREKTIATSLLVIGVADTIRELELNKAELQVVEWMLKPQSRVIN